MLEFLLAAFIAVSNTPTYQQFYSCVGVIQGAHDERENGNGIYSENIATIYKQGEKVFTNEEQSLGNDIFVESIGLYKHLTPEGKVILIIRCKDILERMID